MHTTKQINTCAFLTSLPHSFVCSVWNFNFVVSQFAPTTLSIWCCMSSRTTLISTCRGTTWYLRLSAHCQLNQKCQNIKNNTRTGNWLQIFHFTFALFKVLLQTLFFFVIILTLTIPSHNLRESNLWHIVIHTIYLTLTNGRNGSLINMMLGN